MLFLGVSPRGKILSVGYVEVLLCWVLGMELRRRLHPPPFPPWVRLVASSGLPVDSWD